jgi:hypothetical protein
MSGTLHFFDSRWIDPLRPDVKVGVREKIAPGHSAFCECLNGSPMNNGDGPLSCDPFRDDGRLDSQVYSKPNTSSSNRIEPFDEFFHDPIVRPSLIIAIGIALKSTTREK